ncbi:CpaF family protein [Schaalia canis]|uniref:CpaF family protein n=1 Tax=Schaalia canis TaxID=100469 RepID=A0A3P1SE29_9ACTO|nr:ATPase, T2SS/T4P/T4SS family [Schaalia canis]RRC95237.1 CpaF family protein [Schaalia canis]
MKDYEAQLQWVRDEVTARAIDPYAHTDVVTRIIEDALDRSGDLYVGQDREDLIAKMLADVAGVGPLQPYLDDPEIEEIWINEPTRVFVARGGTPELTPLILREQQVRDLVERMLHHSGRRLDLSQPFVDAMLRGGERLHVVIPPVAGRHWSVNIRKHIQNSRSLEDLVAVGMVPPQVGRFLAAAVAAGLSILVSGATQAGKTTLLRALTGAIPRNRRIITCEEVFELHLPNRDCVALQTRPGNVEGRGEVTLRDLVRETMRMRPEVLIVGEVRGAEALDLLLALNAGVPGMGTIHANSAREALAKLSMLPLLAGENVTSQFVTPTVARSVDLVLHVHRDRTGRRYLREVLSIPGRVEGERIEASEVWSWNGHELHRGPGGSEWHDRFQQAGFELSELLGSE